MAISGYYDVYKLDYLKPRVANISAAISEYSEQQTINREKQKLDDQIKFFQEQEQKLYKALHVKDFKELQDNIIEYNHAVINLSGPRLREYITGILEKEREEDWLKLRAYINDQFHTWFEDWLLRQDQAIGIITDEVLSRSYLEFINRIPGTQEFRTNHRFTSTKGLFDDWSTTNEILVSNMTSHQRQYWEKQLKDYMDNTGDIKISSKGNTVAFNWYSIITSDNTLTSVGTQTSIGYENYKNNKTIRDKVDTINSQIKNYLIGLCQDRQTVEMVINYILEQDPLAFFVGKSTSDVTGICGEIQSMYYMLKLCGGKNPSRELLGTVVKWQGNDKTKATDTGKPHIDILINDLFGIQIKNSTKIQLEDIEFVDASAETVLNRLGIDDDLRNILDNYFGTISFNVGWNIDRRRTAPYIHSQDRPYGFGKKGELGRRATEYLQTYKQLEEMQSKIDKLLAFSAAALIYMGVRESAASNLDANMVWILGGNAVYVASVILQHIKDLLDDATKLSETFHVRFSRSKDQRTIVEALNTMVGSYGADAKTAKIDDRHKDNSYSNQVLKKTILTSSFNFGSLEIK